MMTPHALIERYVLDVARLLPRKQRHDVSFELRALLTEELEAKARETGEALDGDLTLAFLREFGRPSDVATRYGSPITIIDPSDTRGFLMAAALGTCRFLRRQGLAVST